MSREYVSQGQSSMGSISRTGRASTQPSPAQIFAVCSFMSINPATSSSSWELPKLSTMEHKDQENKEDIEGEEDEYGVLLYYKYAQIPDIDDLFAFYNSNCSSLSLLGRVRLSPLGVNVTVSKVFHFLCVSDLELSRLPPNSKILSYASNQRNGFCFL